MLVLRVFALGCGSAFLVLFVRSTFLEGLLPDEPGWTRDLLDAFLVTGLGEELAKLAAFFVGAFLHRELDEPLDGIVYGVAAGLGFASVENVVYQLQLDDSKIIVLRAFTATLGHVAFTGSMGFFFGLAKLSRTGRGALLMVAGLGLAVLFHGLYDIFLFRGGGLAFVSLLCVLPLLMVLIGLKIRWARARSAKYHPDRA
ncbi:MAG: PrsW family intramembrane metalloprotease [Planctomycetota bacterium]|jgi:RsiW-degrading membrane proteinase PrsW (M82 family)